MAGGLLARIDFPQGVTTSCSIVVRFGERPMLQVELPADAPPVASAGEQRVVLDGPLRGVAVPAELTRFELLADASRLVMVLSYGPVGVSYDFAVGGHASAGAVSVDVSPPDCGAIQIPVTADRAGPSVPTSISLPESGWSLLWNGPAQIDQDQWVADVLGFGTGYFVEIGADDGVTNSNTLTLEERLGWQGLIVEANPRLAEAARRRRGVPVAEAAVFSVSGLRLQFVDAGPLGGLVDTLQQDVHAARRKEQLAAGQTFVVTTLSGDDLLAEAGAPQSIDYLSIDTEGSEVEIVGSIDLHRWQVALITIEHAGKELKRARLARILEPLGYVRVRAWFEDWFWHPEIVATRLGLGKDEAVRRIEAALARVPVVRSGLLHERLREARADRDREAERRLVFEGAKPFYPNNAFFVVSAARALRAEGKQAEALELLEMQVPQQLILSDLARYYGDQRMPGRLFELTERWLDLDPEAGSDPVLLAAMRSVVPVRPEVMAALHEGRHPPRAWKLFLELVDDGDGEPPASRSRIVE